MEDGRMKRCSCIEHLTKLSIEEQKQKPINIIFEDVHGNDKPMNTKLLLSWKCCANKNKRDRYKYNCWIRRK